MADVADLADRTRAVPHPGQLGNCNQGPVLQFCVDPQPSRAADEAKVRNAARVGERQVAGRAEAAPVMRGATRQLIQAALVGLVIAVGVVAMIALLASKIH